jgi:hypothetical protein
LKVLIPDLRIKSDPACPLSNTFGSPHRPPGQFQFCSLISL